MIYLIYGENSFLQEQALHKLVADFGGQPESVNVDTLTLPQLADIVRGGSLFSEKRCIVLRQLSNDANLFMKLAEWASEVSVDTTIIIIEQKLDKRTKATKAMLKVVTVINADPLTDRDMAAASEWLRTITRAHDVILSPTQAEQMIQRAFVAGDKPNNRFIDQMQLYRAVQALKGSGKVTDDMIATVLPPVIADSVFDLLEMATRRDVAAIDQAIKSLQPTDDGYRVAGLIFGQWAQLVALATIGDASPQTAADISVHPFVAKKLYESSRLFTRAEIRNITQLAADLDAGLKLSRLTPWDAVYQLLYTIASR